MSDLKYRRLSSFHDMCGYKRIYHIHIRKTGGTSLNKMFLAIATNSPDAAYSDLAATHDHRIIIREKVFVGWNKYLITRGHYFYAFSHVPYHKLRLPNDTLTITCFRDPVERVLSHYNMLMEYKKNNIHHPCMRQEGRWLGQSFNNFLDRIPETQLLNQLFMFSPDLDPEHAIHCVRNISFVLFIEDFVSGIEQINRMTGICLKPIHTRKTQYKATIDQTALTVLRRRLDQEYVFLDKVRNAMTTSSRM